MNASASLISYLCSPGVEGLRTQVYRDSAGIATIGCGHTGPLTKKSPISEQQAYAQAAIDLQSAESCINRNVRVPLTQSMFDALTDMAYNMGCTGLVKSGVIALVNNKDYSGAARKITTVGVTDKKGRRLDGLVKRRQADADMFMQEGTPDATAQVPNKTGAPVDYPDHNARTWQWYALGAVTTVMLVLIVKTAQKHAKRK